jgi:A/G-specific adenine glycosylase
MLEVPSTEWGAAMPDAPAALKAAPATGRWRRVPGVVTHTFTHFHLTLQVWRVENARFVAPDGCRWYPRKALEGEALPSVMRKVLAHALI